MEKFNNILFPVDLSSSSDRIVPYVASVVETYHAKIHLLFVARVFDYFTGIYVPTTSIVTLEKDIVEGAERSLNEFADAHFGGYDGSILSSWGPMGARAWTRSSWVRWPSGSSECRRFPSWWSIPTRLVNN